MKPNFYFSISNIFVSYLLSFFLLTIFNTVLFIRVLYLSSVFIIIIVCVNIILFTSVILSNLLTRAFSRAHMIHAEGKEVAVQRTMKCYPGSNVVTGLLHQVPEDQAGK